MSPQSPRRPAKGQSTPKHKGVLKTGDAYAFVLRTPCNQHDAAIGEPCWELSGQPSVCSPRVHEAGIPQVLAIAERRWRP